MKKLKIGTKIFFSFLLIIVMIISIAVTVIVTNLRTINNIHTADTYTGLQSLVSDLQTQFMNARIWSNMLYERYDDATYNQYSKFQNNALSICHDIYAHIDKYDDLEVFRPDIQVLEGEITDWHRSVVEIRDVNISCAQKRELALQAVNSLSTAANTMFIYQTVLTANEAYDSTIGYGERLERLERIKSINIFMMYIEEVRSKVRLLLQIYDSTESERLVKNLSDITKLLEEFRDKFPQEETTQVLGALVSIDLFRNSLDGFISDSEALITTIEQSRIQEEKAISGMNDFLSKVQLSVAEQMTSTISLANAALFIVVCVTCAAFIVIILALAYRYTIDAMSESINIFETIFNNMEESIIVIAQENESVLFANNSAKTQQDYNSNGLTYWDMFHKGSKVPDIQDTLEELKNQTPNSETIVRYEYETILPNNPDSKWFLSQIMVIPWKGRLAYLETIIDITERKKAEKHMKTLATFDTLTGLYSRNYGLEQFEIMLRHAQKSKQFMTICYFDLDGLKFANDTYGHAEGDRYLRAVAETLRSCVRASDLLVRMGGDEFLAAFPKCLKTSAEIVIGRFKEKMSVLNASGDFPYLLRASIGIYEIHPDTQMSLMKIIEEADKEMYRDKLLHKGGRIV